MQFPEKIIAYYLFKLSLHCSTNSLFEPKQPDANSVNMQHLCQLAKASHFFLQQT